MEILKLLVQVITFLLSIFMLSSCSNGWTVGNFQDSTFVELIDQDSTAHYYDADISFSKDSWCYTHNQWEIIRKK
tara:strand:+ start:1008 stop:1232 length:225 start_codon:yes stop_codon:yes gene_type:complete